MKKQKDYIDLYTDHLISVQGQATATGLSDALEKEVTHKQITGFLLKELVYSKGLWKKVIRKYKKHFISTIKSNRLFATSLENKLRGKFEIVDKIKQADKDEITTIYKKRWKVKEYHNHKSIKHNANLAKSSTKTVTTQVKCQ